MGTHETVNSNNKYIHENYFNSILINLIINMVLLIKSASNLSILRHYFHPNLSANNPYTSLLGIIRPFSRAI